MDSKLLPTGLFKLARLGLVAGIMVFPFAPRSQPAFAPSIEIVAVSQPLAASSGTLKASGLPGTIAELYPSRTRSDQEMLPLALRRLITVLAAGFLGLPFLLSTLRLLRRKRSD